MLGLKLIHISKTGPCMFIQSVTKCKLSYDEQGEVRNPVI